MPKIGTDEVLIGLIQNLSANNVYVLESSSQGVDQGVKLATNGAVGFITFEQLFLLADGATSDVRVWYIIMKSSKVTNIGFFVK